MPRRLRYVVQTVLALGGLVAALVGTVLVAGDLKSLGGGAARGKLADGGHARASTARRCSSGA